MRFILNKIKSIHKLFFIILFLSVFSCSDKEVRPFVGKKVDIHISNKSMAPKNFEVEIEKVVRNNHWLQKGGYETHSVPNINLKFPLKKIFSQNTDQEISDKYFSLANPVVDKKNIYLLSSYGNVTSIDKENFKINWKKKIFSDNFDFSNLGSIVVKLNKDILYLHNGGDLIVGLNKKNGEIIWKFKNQFPFRGNITIKDDYLLANDYNDNLIVFLENKLIWKKKLSQSENAIFTTIR